MGISKQRRYCPDDDRMVFAEKQTPNHLLHLLLSVVTMGAWLVVWVILIVGADLGAYRCPHCGEKTKARPPRNWQPHRLREDADY